MVAATRPPLAGRPADSPLGRLDRHAMTLLPTLRRPAGVTAARMVSALAEPGVAAAVLGVQAALRARRDGWRAACGPAVLVASGAVARRWLSQVIARRRPRASRSAAGCGRCRGQPGVPGGALADRRTGRLTVRRILVVAGPAGHTRRRDSVRS
jgi:hypothetical protein